MTKVKCQVGGGNSLSLAKKSRLFDRFFIHTIFYVIFIVLVDTSYISFIYKRSQTSLENIYKENVSYYINVYLCSKVIPEEQR